MRYLRGLLHVLRQSSWRNGLTVIVASTACLQAGSAIAEPSNLCYMVGPSGQVINLNGICGVKPPTALPPAPSPSNVIPSGTAGVNTSSAGIHRVKIKRREGGTPVIDVRFNGSQTFEMIVDTGASSTVLTQRMAGLLKIVPVGTAKVDTASEKGVKVPLGYLKSVEVAGATSKNLLVAVAGPDLDIGLLGQDFFRNFDVLIRNDSIEFHPR